MPKQRSWTDDELVVAVKTSKSYRAVIKTLGLIPAGGNYEQVKRRIHELNLVIEHFTGKGWNQNWKFDPRIPAKPLDYYLVDGSIIQSYRLKNLLFKAG